MKKSYGRLTRWVLRTSPSYALRLEGREDPNNSLILYSLREDLAGFSGLKLGAPVGVEVYQAIGFGKIEKDDLFFATRPDDVADAYMCLVNMEGIDRSDFKQRFLTQACWLDANTSSRVLADILDLRRATRPVSFPPERLNVQGLEERFGFEHKFSSDSPKRIIGYHRLPF